jgi:tetratricopeptide (TPR) repeat protein
MSSPDQPADQHLPAALDRVSRLLNNDPAGAGELARKILERYPGEVNAATLLAASMRLQGRVHHALKLIQDINERTPDFALAQQELGFSLAALKRSQPAISALERALALQANLPLALHALAGLYAGQGEFQQAMTRLEQCLEFAPDFHAARFDYVRALFMGLEYERALEEIDRLLQARPDDLSWLLQRARILVRIGRFEPAARIYKRVLERHPGMARAHLSHGHALKALGRREDCVAAYQESCRIQPGLGEAWWSLSELKNYRFVESELGAMRRELELLDSRSPEFVHMCFALGKALEHERQYDEAFSFYARGNEARRRGLSWDADAHDASLRRTMQLFDHAFFDRRRGHGCSSDEPVFIVGLPRSGSTLLEQILASHSRVDATMELPNIVSMARRLEGPGGRSGHPRYPDVLAGMDEARFRELGEEYLRQTRILRGKASLFIDKMPNNFLHIGLIRLILPRARIIDARRQAMACCFSAFTQLFARGQEFSYSLNEIGRYYRGYEELMRHWQRELPDWILRVQYEDLVTDTERQIRRMLEFCGLEFEPACLEFHASGRPVRTASSEQVRQPIYTAAVEHWRHFRRHLDPLAAALD